MDELQFQKLVRLLAGVAAVLTAFAGAYLSVTGFGFGANGSEWIGVIGAFLIIVMELVFVQQLQYSHINLTIKVAGPFCFFYDMGTNLLGFYSIHGEKIFTVQTFLSNPAMTIVYIGFAALFSILPIALLSYSLVGISPHGTGDVLQNIIGGGKSSPNMPIVPISNNQQRGQNQNSNNNSGQFPYPAPAGFMPIHRQSMPQQQQSGKHNKPQQTRNKIYGGRP